ncbi:hypothetical protein [Paraburkholderia sp. BL17N1]|uniref:esterase/lipase family protein n=1 Tax=Paraburkholderia sp. BL17N1 TaxID=1938798 RepID=UPI000F28AB17|nr:hypothetical protein [Paraburkholderia sp. BL17N1]RKR44573.1 hypothetical protein B0G82_2185 [Paraburkholderia sp. BL17N1]
MSTRNDEVVPVRDIQFILVHGTFATNAPWMADSSALVGSLRAEFGDDVLVTPFNWDGKNSFASRKSAEIELMSLIEKMSIDRTSPPIVIIAHSHGGNVALRAVSRVRKPTRILALVTLGTPYIIFRYRRNPFYRLYAGAFSLWFGAPILLVALAMLTLENWYSLIICGLAYPALVFFTYPILYRKLEFATQSANSKIHDQELNPSATEVPLLCIRHRADEAHIGLFVLQSIKQVEKILFLFATISDETRYFPFRLALVFLAIAIELAIIGGARDWTQWLNAPISLLLIAPISVVARLITSHKWGLGGRPNITSLCFDVSAEAYPEVSSDRHEQNFSLIFGAWRTAAAYGARRLMTPHSMGYSDPAAIKRICSWIKYVRSVYL